MLQARQQEHSAELRSLQLQVQEERLASAQQLQQQLNSSKGVQAPASDMSSLLVPLHGTRPGGQSGILGWEVEGGGGGGVSDYDICDGG